jgi:hypothetical protein
VRKSNQPTNQSIRAPASKRGGFKAPACLGDVAPTDDNSCIIGTPYMYVKRPQSFVYLCEAHFSPLSVYHRRWFRTACQSLLYLAWSPRDEGCEQLVTYCDPRLVGVAQSQVRLLFWYAQSAPHTYISCIGERAPKMAHSARIVSTGGLLHHHVYWSISSCGLWRDWTIKMCQQHGLGLPIEQEVTITR